MLFIYFLFNLVKSRLPRAREGRGSLEGVEIFQMRFIAKSFTPVCRSRCGAGGLGRGTGAGRFVRCLGPLSLCVVLLVQANRNDTSDQALGPAAESTLSGIGRPCRWALWEGRAVDR